MKLIQYFAVLTVLIVSGCTQANDKQGTVTENNNFENTSRFLENEKFKSRIGELEFVNGFPTAATTETLFDFRTYYRTIEVINQNVFAASLTRMRKSFVDANAGKPNQVLVWKDRMDAKSEFLTANSQTVYAMTFLDLKKDGPTVIIAPPMMLGLLDDMWMHYIGDIGALGPDKGKGGKFLVLPPDYQGNTPAGYYVVRSNTYGVWVALRAKLVDGKTDAANKLYEQLEIYPLAKEADHEPTELINASGMEILTVHDENYHMIEEIAELVKDEHPNAISNEQKFLLASIGIEFGKPFQPSEKDRKIMQEAARVGGAMLRTNMWEYTGDDKWIYGKWWNPFIGGKYTFDPDGYLNYDAQAFFAAYATGVTPAMVLKTVGLGSQYLCTHLDKNGVALDGAKNYRLHIPANVPVKDFWSVLVYDAASRSMLAQSQQFPALDTYAELDVNEDKSIDIYFGPKAPAGHEKNWIETVPGKGWSAIFRLYGPLEPFFDQTWKLNDIEPLNK